MGAVTVRIEGLAEIDQALAELSKAAARGALRRALIKAAQPTVEMARRLAPDDPKTGPPDLHTSITASAKSKRAKGRVGDKEYYTVMDQGGTRAEARQALIAARRAAASIGKESFAVVYVGPAQGSKRNAIKSIVQEFGSFNQPARPYMRPAWEATKQQVLDGLKDILRQEVDKSVARARARALKKAASK